MLGGRARSSVGGGARRASHAEIWWPMSLRASLAFFLIASPARCVRKRLPETRMAAEHRHIDAMMYATPCRREVSDSSRRKNQEAEVRYI